MNLRPALVATACVFAVSAWSSVAAAQDATSADKPPVALAPDAGCVPQPDCLVMDPSVAPDAPTGHTRHYKRVIKRDAPDASAVSPDDPALKSR